MGSLLHGSPVTISNDTVKHLLVERGEQLFQARSQLVAFSGDPAADALLNDLEHHPHAFVLACVMDRQIKAERAWLIPYLFSQKLGRFDFGELQSLSLADVRKLMTKPVPLHRFPERMTENFYNAIRVIADQYHGDASNIWRDRPPSAEVVFRFLQFRGVGPKIATMATNILARDFKVPFSDYYSVDISADVHVRRVFWRLGLIGQNVTTEELIYRARALHPPFPGLMDFPAWEIGRTWCRLNAPLCDRCYMQDICPTASKLNPRARATSSGD